MENIRGRISSLRPKARTRLSAKRSRRPFLIYTVAVLLLTLTSCGGDAPNADESFPNDREAQNLAEAVANDDAEGVRDLLSEGADPNAQGEEGINMLQYAISANSLSALEALLEAGADPNKAGIGGDTAVHIAAGASAPEAMELVLRHGGDPNARNSITGSTALVPAILMRNDAQVRNNTQFQMLLDAGVDPNIADLNDDAPLHTAGRINAGDYILALLEAGADPQAENSGGATFQEYYFGIQKRVLNDKAKREREEIRAWLHEHDVPLREPPDRESTQEDREVT